VKKESREKRWIPNRLRLSRETLRRLDFEPKAPLRAAMGGVGLPGLPLSTPQSQCILCSGDCLTY